MADLLLTKRNTLVEFLPPVFVCYVYIHNPVSIPNRLVLRVCVLGLHDNKVQVRRYRLLDGSTAAHGLVGVQKQRTQIDVVIEDHMPKIHKNSSTL